MNAARLPLLIFVVVFATVSLLAARSASAADQHKFDPNFLWFVSGHGVNVSQVADGGDTPFATTKFVSIENVPPAAVAQAKIGEIRDAVARLQTPGEHVLPAGLGPDGASTDLLAAGLLAASSSGVDSREIDLVVGIDLKTGMERMLVHATGSGTLLDPRTADAVATGFLPLYSVGPDRVRIHFKSDSQYRPPIDRTALTSFGATRTDTFGPHAGAGSAPIAVLLRTLPTP